MKKAKKETGLDYLHLMEKRLGILVGGRITDRNKMQKAAKSIGRLRRKVDGWNSTEEIRKWREAR